MRMSVGRFISEAHRTQSIPPPAPASPGYMDVSTTVVCEIQLYHITSLALFCLLSAETVFMSTGVKRYPTGKVP